MHTVIPPLALTDNRRRKLIRSLFIGAVIAAILLLLWWGDLFWRTRLRLTDVYVVPSPATDTIAIIGIDDAAYQTYGRSITDWDRTLFADLVTRLSQAGARVIVFDVLFTEPAADFGDEQTSYSQDEAFAAAIQAARTSDARTRTILPVAGSQRISSDAGRVRFVNTLYPPDTLAQTVDNVGYINVLPDADNVIRRYPSLIESEQHAGVSLGIAAYLAYLRVPSAAIPELISYSENVLRLTPERTLTVDENGLWDPNYFVVESAENPLQTYPTVPMIDVLQDRADMSLFNDRIVLVGVVNSAGTTDLYTVPTAPGDRLLAGVEVHANAIETLIQNRAITRSSPAMQVTVILLLPIMAAVLYGQLRWYWMIPAALLMMANGVFVAFVLFSTRNIGLDLFFPLLALSVPVVAILMGDIALEIRQRQVSEFLLKSVVEVSAQQPVLDRTLQRLANDIQNLLGAQAGSIWLRDRETGDISLAYAWNGAAPSPANFEAITHRAANNRRMVLDHQQIAQPIEWQGRLIGVMCAALPHRWGSGARVSRHSLTMLRTLADQIAPVLENAVLFAETEIQKSRLEATLSGSPAGMLVLDESLNVIKTNAAVDHALGLACEKHIGSPITTLLRAAKINDEFEADFNAQLQTWQPFRIQLKHQQKTFAIDAAPIPNNREWIIVLNNVSALAELNELKTHMIKMATHDLNNPLTAILVNTQLILDGSIETNIPPKVRAMIERVYNSGNNMLRIITDILSLERTRSNAHARETFMFADLIDDVLEQCLPDAEMKSQVLECNVDDDLPPITGDRQQLRQAVANLVGNAIKYTPDGGSIDVRVFGLDDRLSVEVEDTGYGIPLESQKRIFQEFYRAKSAATAHIPGTGLGLSLVKSVIEAHGGRIWFSSQEGHGSTFCFELPLSTVSSD